MVYSASMALPDNPEVRQLATHFLVRHALFLVIGFVAAIIAFQVPMAPWEKYAPWLFVLRCCCWSWCWCRGMGKVVNGRGAGWRWAHQLPAVGTG